MNDEEKVKITLVAVWVVILCAAIEVVIAIVWFVQRGL